jgi:drug/metabolite transporter (DMT)-like permease
VVLSVLRSAWGSAPLLLSGAVLFWAGNSIAGRSLAGVAPPLALTFWRWALAFVLITPFAWRHVRADAPELRRRWKMVVLLAATGVASFGALLYVGLETTTALNSVLMQAAIPPLIMLFALLALRERTSLIQVAGVTLSLAGVLAVIAEGQPRNLLRLHLNPGDGYVLVGVVLYAVYSLLLRFKPGVHPMSLLWATFLASAVLLAPFYAWESLSGRVFSPTAPALAGLAYVVVFPSFLAYLCFNRGVELFGAARASQFMHLMPVFGAILAVALLGEAFRSYHLAGVLLIGAGIAVANLRRRPQPSQSMS